jgi:hypothetical protein
VAGEKVIVFEAPIVVPEVPAMSVNALPSFDD